MQLQVPEYEKLLALQARRTVKAGGRIALHDYKAGLPGVDVVVASAIASNLWENKEIVDSIWSATKK